MKLIRIAALAISFLAPVSAFAAYNANIQGRLTGVFTYTDGDYVYFQIANQPTSHQSCNPAYFVIEGNIPTDRMNRMFARLMSAWATGETVNIGFDAQGDCAHGFIRVHRVG